MKRARRESAPTDLRRVHGIQQPLRLFLSLFYYYHYSHLFRSLALSSSTRSALLWFHSILFFKSTLFKRAEVGPKKLAKIDWNFFVLLQVSPLNRVPADGSHQLQFVEDDVEGVKAVLFVHRFVGVIQNRCGNIDRLTTLKQKERHENHDPNLV